MEAYRKESEKETFMSTEKSEEEFVEVKYFFPQEAVRLIFGDKLVKENSKDNENGSIQKRK